MEIQNFTVVQWMSSFWCPEIPIGFILARVPEMLALEYTTS